MVLRNISKENILQALTEIGQSGVPSRREPTKFFLSYNNQFYPPKMPASKVVTVKEVL